MFGRLKNFVTNWIPSASSDSSTTETGPTPVAPAGENAIACEAITNKLSEVSDVAESLDASLRDTQSGIEVLDTNSSSSEKKCEHNRSGSLDEWSSSVKSTEDESFVTASDYNCTLQSRSSSFQTASECRTSPMWSFDKSSFDAEEETDTETDEVPAVQFINGIMSSGNGSFDSSDHSFLSAQASNPSVSGISGKSDQVSSDEKLGESEVTDSANSKKDTKTSTELNKPEVRCCEIRQTSAWSEKYYHNVVAKHAIKGCIS